MKISNSDFSKPLCLEWTHSLALFPARTTTSGSGEKQAIGSNTCLHGNQKTSRIGISQADRDSKPRASHKSKVHRLQGSDGCKTPQSRYLHACCLSGSNLYLYGGKDGYMPLKDFWKLDMGMLKLFIFYITNLC